MDEPARVVRLLRCAMTQPVVPSSDSLHAVRFYQDTDSLCRMIATFLHQGIADGLPALVVATEMHRVGVATELTKLGVDVPELRREGSLLLLDARETLSLFMVDGKPQSGRFNYCMGEALNRACHGRRGATMRVFGEMVDVLWKEGLHDAAIRLEVLWNQLAATRTFSLLCAYSMGNFYKDATLDDICSHHTHVVSADGEIAPRG
jgi:hypothetical protein